MFFSPDCLESIDFTTYLYIKGSGAQKQRLQKLLWTLWFDEKSVFWNMSE